MEQLVNKIKKQFNCISQIRKEWSLIQFSVYYGKKRNRGRMVQTIQTPISLALCCLRQSLSLVQGMYRTDQKGQYSILQSVKKT